MKIHERCSVQAGVVLLGVALCGSAAGQDTAAWKVHPTLHDTWNFQLGAFSANVDTTARLDSTTTGAGTSVSFEDDLGLADRKVLGSFLASVRLGQRWKIEAEYFSLSRGKTRAIDRTISWGDRTFTANTVVTSEFQSDTYRLSGGFAFLKDANSELGVALGIHATDISASISASGVAAETGDALAPLPTIGIYGGYAFSPKWLLSGRVDYFSLSYDNFDGSLVNASAGVEYRFTRHFGIGAGYRHVEYDLSVTKSKFTGAINYKFGGPTLFAAASF